MRISICASEGAPYAKSGGLGDVMEALPAALQRIEGNEVALFLPYYSKIKANENYVFSSKKSETEWECKFKSATDSDGNITVNVFVADYCLRK